MKRYLKKIMPLCIVMLAVFALICSNITTEAAAKKPTKITLQTTAKTIDVKGKATVSVKSVTPKNASDDVKFTSSNKKIATVSSKGVVTGKKEGKVTITATSKENSKVKAKITLKVKNIKPKSMSINYTSMKVEVGKSKTLKVTAKPAGVYCPLKWTSSDKSIATVDKNGVVTGKKNGTVTITCKSTVKNTDGKYMTKKCKVTVLTKVKSLKANAETLTLNVKDAKGTVKFTVSPKTASNKKLVYSSSDKNVAVVDKSGKVTATGYGTATITAKTTDGTNKSASYTVNVVKPEAVEETQVFVSPEYAKAAIDGLLPESENLLIAEVSWGAYASASAYNEAHIPGALHINSDAVEYDDCDPWPYGDGIDDLAQYGDEYHYGANEVLPEDNFNIRSGEQLTQFMKTYGITQDTNVILYGNNASNSAVTRVAFAMLYAGVDNVKVVDGGFKAWKALELPTESTVNKPVATDKDFGVTIPEHPEYIMSIEEVQENLETNPNFNLVSIRSRDEFEGKTSGYGYIDFAGEPEGAIWGKDTDDGTYVQDGKIASIDALKQYLEEGGGSYDNELSFYCGTGWRATIPFLMAYQDGKEDISLYDGGWWLWTVKQEKEADKYPVQTITPEQAARFAKMSFENEMVSVAANETVKNNLVIKYQRTDLKITYTSDNEAVATVAEDGTVTTVGAGTATITAAVEGDERIATYTVEVK